MILCSRDLAEVVTYVELVETRRLALLGLFVRSGLKLLSGRLGFLPGGMLPWAREIEGDVLGRLIDEQSPEPDRELEGRYNTEVCWFN